MRATPGWAEASRRGSPYLDPAIGIVAAALALFSLLRTDPSTIDVRLDEPDLLAALATVGAAGSLAWRRRRPMASYLVMFAGALVVTLSGHYIGLLSVLILFSMYSLAAHGRRWDAVVGLGLGVVCFIGLALLDVPDLGTTQLLQALALLTAAWALGDAIRSRRQQQRDQLQAAVAEERLRIARDLHDVVAHSMSLIAVQAGVGAHVVRTDAPGAQRALEIIADTAREALEQTRSMLGMLREETEEGSRPPTRGLDDLAALVADVRTAGLEVELVQPVVPGVDAAVSLTAFRVVQESLTNVIKHSAASTATVTVVVTGGSVDLVVADPGPARSAVGTRPGHGLVGLAERVRLVGGTVQFGTQGAGFRVRATLPIGATR